MTLGRPALDKALVGSPDHSGTTDRRPANRRCSALGQTGRVPLPETRAGTVTSPADQASFSLPERVALLLIGVAPAAFLPRALDRFVFPKLAAVAAAVAVAALCPRRGRLPRSVVGLVGAGFVLLAVSALASASPLGAFVGRSPRYEGVFVLLVYVAAGAAGAWLLGPARRRGAVPWWLRVLAVMAVAVALEAVLEAFGLRPLQTDVARPGSLLGNASDEGALGVLLLGPFVAVSSRVRDPWCVVGALASAVAVVLSASRGALVGALAVLVVLVALGSSRRTRLVLAAAAVVLVAAAFSVPATRDRVLGTSPLAGTTVSGRTLLWDETLHLVAQHSLIGVGPSGYLDAIPAEHNRTWQVEVGPSNPPDSPHNWVLQAAADGGIPLAGLALALAAVVMWRGRRAVSGQPSPAEDATFAGMWAGLAGYGCALAFAFTSPGVTPLAAFFGGALVALPPSRLPGEAGAGRWREARIRGARVGRVGTAATLAALALLLALAALAEIPLRSAVIDTAAGRYQAAQHEFAIAEALRPWDGELEATAGHAFVVAAEQDVAADLPTGAGPPAIQAIEAAVPAVNRELSDYPDSLQALEDAAAIAELTHRPGRAASLLARAQALAPLDPEVLYSRGVVAGSRGQLALAVALLRQSAILSPTDPSPWQELAAVYAEEGNSALAAEAARHARDLGSTSG
jgi:O-antigen ligase